MGQAIQILGMHIVRDRTKKLLWLSQEKYVTKVLQRFGMESAKPVGSTLQTNRKLSKDQCPKLKSEKAEMSKVPYASEVGSLMYAMVCTRANIGYAVKVVRQYMSNPRREHWTIVKWILQYLRGPSSMCLRFSSGNPTLEGYTDSNMSTNVNTSRSTSGYVMTYVGGVVSWQSTL